MKASSSVLVLVFLGVFSLSCANASSSEESEDVNMFIKSMVDDAYFGDKLKTILQVLELLQINQGLGNATLVASQKIYDDVGNVKEIRTIELFNPTMEQTPSLIIKQHEADEFNLDDIDKIRDGREMIQEYVALGLEFIYVEPDKDENMESGLYMSNDLFAVKRDGVIYANKSIHLNTIEQVQAEYKQLMKTGTVPTSYLAYDKEGNFIKAESTVVPEEFAVIESDFGTPSEEIVETIITSLVNVFLESKSKDDVPDNLRQNLESHYPGVTFLVTIDEPVGAYINKDFSVHLNYELGLEDSFSYSVYGYKRTA